MHKRLTQLEQAVSPARRRFLRQSIAWTAAGAAPFLFDLQRLALAADTSDYKALVCVFLAGGNDNGNTVVPYSTADFNDYVAARGNDTLALTLAELDPINAASISGRQLAMPKAMAPLRALYEQGKAAIMANVGVLADPLTLVDYKNNTPGKRLPPQLFSHSDQVNFWQIGVPTYDVSTGWAGRIADRMAASGANANSKVALSISLAGTNRLQTGATTIQYPLSPGGANSYVNLREPITTAHGKALDEILKQPRSHLFEQEYVAVTNRARDAYAQVQAALDSLGNAATAGSVANLIKTQFDPQSRPTAGAVNPLAQQLEMVAKMIAARTMLGHSRQIFYVSLGGFDLHDKLDESHASLQQRVASAAAIFYEVTKLLGVDNNVTTFTASDFGRTLQTNGRGSDHGWGGHHFVVGGAVKGGNVYGNWNGITDGGGLLSPFPIVKLGGPEDVGQGRLLPTTAVDQYAAVLARWFGVSNSELVEVLPNIGRFPLPAAAQSFI
ncbi:MAG: DUF1501 domain-containing protein [Gammaproteobacteria bacterium]|nr:DUF1501 domain-containing protein [Gammaproteobacteria bacterium]